jgi:hypothetical protein
MVYGISPCSPTLFPCRNVEIARTPGTRASAGTCSVSYQALNSASTSAAGVIPTSKPPVPAGASASPGRICSPAKRSRRRHLALMRFAHIDKLSPEIAR